MDGAHDFILIGGALGLAAIFTGRWAARLGAPLLLVFLVLGMLAGEDGPGGLRFDDFRVTYLLGSLALIVILFEGGLKTPLPMLRRVAWPSVALATVGVAVTAGLVGTAAMLIWHPGWAPALLLGALVAPTDAAAVASVLRLGRVTVPERLSAVLEVESGLNDPMAVFLTLFLVEAILQPGHVTLPHAVALFGGEMLGGAAMGAGAGWLLSHLPGGLRDDPSLHPVVLLAGSMAVFGLAQTLGASGFLAVYVAGVMVGERAGPRLDALHRAFDAFAWVAQIGLFLMLGLLVTPHRLLPMLPQALLLAVVLILVARPLAAALCLKPFGFGWGETGFAAWVGLRGAVPIYLAIIPVLSGVQQGEAGFAVAFVIVLASLAVQGWTIGPAARLLLGQLKN